MFFWITYLALSLLSHRFICFLLTILNNSWNCLPLTLLVCYGVVNISEDNCGSHSLLLYSAKRQTTLLLHYAKSQHWPN